MSYGRFQRAREKEMVETLQTQEACIEKLESFVESVYEVVYGDNAVNRQLTQEQSLKALINSLT
tara:strand:+ start:133 stop:324 length:192 start_codon:yes stop_codon:yes gene_type:complete